MVHCRYHNAITTIVKYISKPNNLGHDPKIFTHISTLHQSITMHSPMNRYFENYSQLIPCYRRIHMFQIPLELSNSEQSQKKISVQSRTSPACFIKQIVVLSASEVVVNVFFSLHYERPRVDYNLNWFCFCNLYTSIL